jgi:WD40 repeat protein
MASMRHILGSLILAALAAGAAQAQVDRAITRAQTQNIERAIENATRDVVVPQLRVKRPVKDGVVATVMGGSRDLLVMVLGDGTARIWDVTRGIQEQPVIVPGHALTSAAWVGATNQVAFGTGDGGIVIWDDRTSKVVRVLPGTKAPIVRLRSTADGGNLFGADATGRIGRWTVNEPLAPTIIASLPGGAAALDLNPADGTVLTVDQAGEVRFFDTLGHPIGMLATAASTAAAFGPDAVLATANADGHVQVWNGRGATWVLAKDVSANEGRIVALTPLGRRSGFASISAKEDIAIVPLAAGATVLPLGAAPVATCLSASSSGDRVYACGADGLVRLWDTTQRQALGQMIVTPAGWAVIDQVGRFDGSPAALDDVEWVAASAHLPVDHFSDAYYEPLLIKKLHQANPVYLASAAPPLAKGIVPPPSVALSLAEPPKAGSADIVVAAKATSGGVAEIRLYHNGRAVDAARRVADKSTKAGQGTDRNVTYRLDLVTGRNELEAVAIGDSQIEGETGSLAIDVTGTPKPPVLRLLGIGIDQYQAPELALRFAVADATAFMDSVEQHPAADFAAVKPTLLVNAEASSGHILDALADLSQSAPDDIVVVLLAGHGKIVKNEWYFLPADLPGVTTNKIQEFGISTAALQKALDKIPALRIALVIDACQSGAIADPLADSIGQRSLRTIGRGLGVHMLAATQKDQNAIEFDQLHHGALTYVMLEGLAGQASDKQHRVVTIRTLFDFVQKETPVVAREALETVLRTRGGTDDLSVRGQLAAIKIPIPVTYSRGDDFDLEAVGGK